MLILLGEQLKAARLAKTWTQKELAERAGISISMVSAVERGQRNVTIETLAAIATALRSQLSIELAEAPALRREDAELVDRVRRIVPRLDPALRATLEILLSGWERSTSSAVGADRQELVKTG